MKKSFSHHIGSHGYTLIEVVSVAAIIMFAGVFLLRISNSIQGRSQFVTTDNRFTIIEAKMKHYYLAHEQLPVNSLPLPLNEVPLNISILDLEQKYKLDGWGNPFQYDPGVQDPATGLYLGLLDVLDTNGNGFAASVTSRGPDQNIGTSDDITEYIDLSIEAEQVVQKKLNLLEEKVSTYNALFAGIDNDGVNVDNPGNPDNPPAIDEDPREASETGGISLGCPPISGFTNDPASGLRTLDNIEIAMDGGFGGDAYSCPLGNQLAFHLVTYYHLPTGIPGGYDIDPWGNAIIWGYLPYSIGGIQYPGRTLDDGTTIPDSMDFHSHKFFSSGSNITTVEDDIIYNGQ